MNERYVSVRVRGEFACFTRPEAKVERVTYPILTPSAARGILEAIYWHPEFRWRIREIRVLKPVRTFSLVRNEVNFKIPATDPKPKFADEARAQRNSVVLRDVDYVILADADPKPGVGADHAKYRDIFRRRVASGKCFHRPALGCREFAAEFEPAEDAPPPIDWTEDLGLMLWDLDFSSKKPPFWPQFFHAEVKAGVMLVPERPLGVQP